MKRLHDLLAEDTAGDPTGRHRLWTSKRLRQITAELAGGWGIDVKGDPYQLTVTVCHYPTGASKWNPIEHRLFGKISKHWAGQPLIDYPTVVRPIGETRTQTGLTVTCTLLNKFYPSGLKITDGPMDQLNLRKHAVLPDWNYTLCPRNNRN